MKSLTCHALVLVAALLLVSPGWATVTPDSSASGERMPKATDVSQDYDIFDNSVVRPMTRVLDPVLWVRKASAHPREAYNIDSDDQVRLPSTWWQPRLGFVPVSPEQMLRGPGPGTGPAPGRWTVTRQKTEGVSPGFFIRDGNGDRFLLKLDHPDHPELTSGADVIASVLFWAAGYNTPDDAITFFRAESLVIAPGAQFTDSLGHKRALTMEDIHAVLESVAHRADGSFRALSSRLLPGKPLGPFEYHGRRRDDPEDRIPHELHRELRGLWVIESWLSNTDARAGNSLDTWVAEDGRSFVRHYLLDFNATLGADSRQVKPAPKGYEYFIDWGRAGHELATAGLSRLPWEQFRESQVTGVGLFESGPFDPEKWRPDYPNPAFDARTPRDVRWGARIVAAFTDEHIRAAVVRAQFTDPRATEILTRVLIERRDKIAARWLNASTAVAVGVSSQVFAQAAASEVPSDSGMHSAGEDQRGGILQGARGGVALLASDFGQVASSPLRLNRSSALWAAGVLGAAAVIYNNDAQLSAASIRNKSEPGYGAVFQVGKVLEPIGYTSFTIPVYCAAWSVGHLTGCEPVERVMGEVIASNLINQSLRRVTIWSVGRNRPSANLGPRSFDPGLSSTGSSFFSGHVSVGFELATILSYHVHSAPFTAAAYALASTMAVDRITTRNHWPSDCFVPMVTGTLIARTVVRRHEAHPAGAPSTVWTPTFSASNGAMGFQVTHRF